MDIFELPVHPDAEAFRMLPPDELQALADDIKEKGLNHPLVTTTITSYDESTGEKNEAVVLVDGRNRREACKMAGVTPAVVDLNGRDVKGFITSENGRRRHDTKGMQAMSYAIMYPEKQQGKKENIPTESGSADYVRRARTVYEYCDTETVEKVKIGTLSLPDAYDMARDIRDGVKEPTDEERLALISVELADKVREGEMTLVGAEAEHAEIERIARVNRESALKALRGGVYDFGSIFLSDERVESTANLMTDYHEEFNTICGRDTVDSIKYLKAIEAKISTLIEKLEQ